MKLLATDYDGTLKFGGSVLPADLEAIHRWRDAGNLFVIVTGRSMESISGETEEFKIPVDYYVTNNGGMAFDKDGNALLSSTLDTITAIDLMFASHEHPDVVSYVVERRRQALQSRRTSKPGRSSLSQAQAGTAGRKSHGYRQLRADRLLLRNAGKRHGSGRPDQPFLWGNRCRL